MSVRRALLPALSSLLLLTGCGGGQSTADPPVLQPSSSATSPPPKPETPEHFIRRWAAEDKRMQNTGHTRRFRTLSKECEACVALADRIDRIYRAGGYVATKGWRILRLDIAARAKKRQVVNIHVFSNPTTYRETRGGPRKSFPGGRVTYQVVIASREKSWIVSSFAQVAS